MCRQATTVLMLLALPAWPVLASRWIASGDPAVGPQQPASVLAAPRRVGPPAVPARRSPEGAGGSAVEPPGDPLGVSERTLKRACAEWPRRLSGIPCWRSVRTDHVQMSTNARAAEIRWTSYAIEWSLPRVAGAIGASSLPLIGVTLFNTRAAFDAYRGAHGGVAAESLYDPQRRRIVLCAEGGRAARLAAVVHELVHALMHDHFGRTGPPWLAEGVAERVTEAVLATLDVRLKPDWDAVPLAPDPVLLMPLTAAEFAGAQASGNYATAISWVNHLLDREGRSVAGLLNWSPTPRELEQIQHRWRQHREAQEPAPD